MKKLIENILKSNTKPPLFEPGEPKFWDDTYISKSMLEAHLDSSHDAASRRSETIDKTIAHLLASGLLRPDFRVLDLGCGPGLYSERLSGVGMQVVGLDISQSSIDYAVEHTKDSGHQIDYICMNFFDMEYTEEFDIVIQVYGELCTFPDDKRDVLLAKVHKALKKGGLFIFDVSTRILRSKNGLVNRWYGSEGGFWRPGRHIVLEQGFDYPENDVSLDQYIIMDSQGVAVYRNWFHDYSLHTIKRVLESVGFETAHVWNDLTGSKYTENGEWIAIVVRKDEN